jgi:DNA-directed RNA polymerase specialized sigma24 family protein
MTDDDSSGDWMRRLKAGDQQAAQELWNRYFAQLVVLARKKLRFVPTALADEEDVALSALDSFCRGAREGRFPDLQDQNNLWALLVVITARKACDLIQHERRQKRGSEVHLESLNIAEDSTQSSLLSELITREPSPEFAAQIAEEYQLLLDKLPDPELRRVVLLKMEGYTNDEIAGKLGCVRRTVDRRLWVIRSLWSHADQP